MGMFDNLDLGGLLQQAIGGGSPDLPQPAPPPAAAIANRWPQPGEELQPGPTAQAPQFPGGVPIPRPRPPEIDTAQGPVPDLTMKDWAFAFPPPGPATTPAPPQPPVTAQAPGLGPARAAPATPTAPAVPMGPGPMGPSGAPGMFLSNIFGPDPRRTMQMTESLGRGLSAVGQNWNKPAGAAFAGTAGAALLGGGEGDRKYFKDLATAVRINDAYDTAQTRTDLMRQKLEVAQRLGTTGGRNQAWQNSEAGRFYNAEKLVQSAVEGKRKELQRIINEGSPKEVAAAREEIAKLEPEARARIYPGMGLDPRKYENYRNIGQAAYGEGGKIDVKKTGEQAYRPNSWNDFQNVPKGAYYWTKNKEGKEVLMQRKDDPPLPADHPQSPLAQIPDFSEGGEEAAA